MWGARWNLKHYKPVTEGSVCPWGRVTWDSVAGKDRAREAAFKAFQSPLLDTGIEQASGIVWNITGPSNMTLAEVSAATTPPLYSCPA